MDKLLAHAWCSDLHFGDVLFYYYQGEDFEAITRLQAYPQWGRMPHHDAETELLLGGLYLSLGLHNEAGERFETLLTQSVPEGVRNRAWFYLGKVWYARGYLDRAERAIKEVQGGSRRSSKPSACICSRNILMRQQRFDEAIALLKAGRAQRTVRLAGLRAVQPGRRAGAQGHCVTEADPFLTPVGTIESRPPRAARAQGPREPRARVTPTCRTTSRTAPSPCSSACASTARTRTRRCSAWAGRTRRTASSRKR